MSQDDAFEAEIETPRRGGGRGMVIAGVALACVLGVGLGLWARPSAVEQGEAPPSVQPVSPPKPTGKLQVVIEDMPAPIGRLLEVLPAADDAGVPAAAVELEAPPPADPLPALPKSPPAGLMKADAPAPAEKLVVLPLKLEPKPEPKARPKTERKPDAKPDPKARRVQAKSDKALVAKSKVKVAKAEPRKAPKAKTSERKETRLAKAEPPKRKAARSERAEPPSKAKLAALVRAVKAAPKKLKTEVAKAERRSSKRELAKADPPKKPRKAREPKRTLVKTPPPARPAPDRPLRGEASLRLARNTCVSEDPGEALVCADPRLGVRERQLQRAYRDAEAAGVPQSKLRRQQERWRAARAAAAREAPWAVDEVYQARIAELNDLSRNGDRY